MMQKARSGIKRPETDITVLPFPDLGFLTDGGRVMTVSKAGLHVPTPLPPLPSPG